MFAFSGSINLIFFPFSGAREYNLDLCIALDNSLNINGNDEWELEKEFASTLIGALYYALDSLHVGLVIFSEETTIEIPLHRIKDINEVRNETESSMYSGNSNSRGRVPLFETRTKCFSTQEDRLAIANVAIFVTGSMPDNRQDRDRSYEQADSLRKTGTTIIAVGTDDVDSEFLKGISSEGEYGNYFQAASFSEMSEFVQPILTRALEAGKLSCIIFYERSCIVL